MAGPIPMKLPLPAGWKLGAWLLASFVWTGYYLVFSLPQEAPSPGLLSQLFNWLFPIGLLYLLMTVGQRRS
jgi:hypothetical protein